MVCLLERQNPPSAARLASRPPNPQSSHHLMVTAAQTTVLSRICSHWILPSACNRVGPSVTPGCPICMSTTGHKQSKKAPVSHFRGTRLGRWPESYKLSHVWSANRAALREAADSPWTQPGPAAPTAFISPNLPISELAVPFTTTQQKEISPVCSVLNIEKVEFKQQPDCSWGRS